MGDDATGVGVAEWRWRSGGLAKWRWRDGLCVAEWRWDDPVNERRR